MSHVSIAATLIRLVSSSVVFIVLLIVGVLFFVGVHSVGIMTGSQGAAWSEFAP